MMLPPRTRPHKHAGQRRGRIHHPTRGGSTNKRPAPQSGSDGSSGTLGRGRGESLTGWQESEELSTCDTPSKPDDITDPTPPIGSTGRIYDVRSTLPHPQMIEIPYELGEYIDRDALLVRDLVWEGFVRERRGQGYFSYLGGMDHPVRLLLRQYRNMGGGYGFFWDVSGRRDSGDQPWREGHKILRWITPPTCGRSFL